jgi:hypothetical protein
LTAAVVLVAAPVANAHGGRRAFSLVLAPPSVAAGAQATLKNRSTYEKLGSADITVPAELTGVSVTDPPGYATATLSGGVIEVRDAKLAPGASLALAITATAPCSGATLMWSATANSPLTLDTASSQLTTTVTGACALRYVSGHAPANARVGQTITASPYDTGGPAVQVEVVDGGGSRVTSSTASITIALGPGTGAGTHRARSRSTRSPSRASRTSPARRRWPTDRRPSTSPRPATRRPMPGSSRSRTTPGPASIATTTRS